MPAVSSSKPKVIASLLWFLLTLAVVIGTSLWLRMVWSTPAEELPDTSSLAFGPQMTVGQVVKQVQPLLPGEPELAPKLVGKSLQVNPQESAQRTLAELGIEPTEAAAAIGRTLALKAERESKDFKRIFLKFGLWIILLIVPLVILARGGLTPRLRLVMLGSAVAIFGIILGSDPSPMGTVKDAVTLFGIHRAVFAPRIIALGVFLLLVVIANKFICSWGCQFGTLQEFIHRLNRPGKTGRSALPVIKLPFVLTNTVRILTFAALTLAAFIWAFDLIGLIDPFKVFKPAHLGWVGGAFLVIILVAALFTYRPWCNLFCPFGLVSWLFERLSFWKIRVDYGRCTACRACTKACPSQAMEGILTGKALPADCFSCGDCLPACPTSAVQFTRPGVIRPSEERGEILKKLSSEN